MLIARCRVALPPLAAFAAIVAQAAFVHGEMMHRAAGQPDTTEYLTAGETLLLPASYEGDVPAADGPGIRYHLDLFPDHVFYLRLTYLGRGEAAVHDDLGTWSISQEGRDLTLRGGSDTPVLFTVKSGAQLRLLDSEGQAIVSPHNYDLRKVEPFSPIEPRVKMRGMYSYLADAGLFQECRTRRTLPVSQEEDNASLESAYSRTRREPGESLLADLEGRIATRSRMEGGGPQDMLIVRRFFNVWPGETCGAQFSTATLTNTYWKLVRLGERPASIPTNQREPYLMLRQGETRQVGGFTGCNRLTGRYEVDGRRLRFPALATTKMACAEGMDQEREYLEALGAAWRWSIRGEHLDLYDSEGALIARFEARYME